jgi:predicted NBD/HSP70 family sugar kinase
MSTAFVGNAALIVRINRASILRLVKERGPISRAEIAKLLELNPTTVGRITGHLLQRRLLIDVGAAPSRGGRRATLLQYNHKAGTVVGVDLNGTCLAGALADLGGDFIYRTERPVSAMRDPDENLAQTIALIGDLLDSDPAVRQSVRAIGIAAPSVVQHPDGVVTLAAALGWRGLPLKALLEQRFGYPVFVQNESDLGALAESVWGVGRQIERLVWLNVGPGIGSGIVIHGRLYQGAHQAAGEVGYIPPDRRFLGQVYDTFGCMELQGSGGAILDKARLAIAGGVQSVLAEALACRGTLRMGDLYEATRQNDALAVRLLNEMADYLSLIIVSIVCVLDPDLIALGQELTPGYDLFQPRIEARIKGLLPAMPQIVPSGLKPEAVLQGAVALALQATEEQFYFRHSAFGDALGR